MTPEGSFTKALARMPLVAILRGVQPDEAVPVGEALVGAGIEILEVPLNSPSPYASIRRLRDAMGARAVVGAGTVLSRDEVKRVVDSGGDIAVAPNTDEDVIENCFRHGILPVPGFATPSEAFRAVRAGAEILKLFPAHGFAPGYGTALAAVLPPRASLLAVGGVGPDNATDYLARGFAGLGIGSGLYRPGQPVEVIGQTAVRLVTACRDWMRSRDNNVESSRGRTERTTSA